MTRHIAVRKTDPSTLARKAYITLEEMIVTLILQPGAHVTEGELIRRTQLGRTPVREALQRLARERLVMILPRKGIMVTDVNIAEQLSLLELRRVLDRFIAGKAAQRASSGQRAEMRRQTASLMEKSVADDLARFMQFDRACDELLEAACANPYAVRAVMPLHAHCRRFWYLHRRNGDIPVAAALHRRLLAAVAAGKITQAENASDKLLDYLVRFTRRTLDQHD